MRALAYFSGFVACLSDCVIFLHTNNALFDMYVCVGGVGRVGASAGCLVVLVLCRQRRWECLRAFKNCEKKFHTESIFRDTFDDANG